MRTIQRDIVGAFIFSSDGKVLLGTNRNGGVYEDMWIVPGGGVDEGETKEQAVIREIQEEIGLDISQAKLEQVDYVQTGQSEKNLRENNNERVLVEMTFYDVVVTLDQPAEEVVFNIEEDFGKVKWFTKDQLPGIEMSEPCKFSLRKLGWI